MVKTVFRKPAAAGVKLPDLRKIPTYVINLRRRPDRKALMKALVAKLHLKADFVEAADGQAIRDGGSVVCSLRTKAGKLHNVKHSVTFQLGAGFPSWLKAKGCGLEALPGGKVRHLVRLQRARNVGEKRGLLGSILSHGEALRRFLRSGAEAALILEDDADLALAEGNSITPATFFRRFGEAKQYMAPDWEALYLGGVLGFASKSDEVPLRVGALDVGHLIEGRKTYQVHAYVVRREAAQRLLEQLKTGQAVDAAAISALRRTYRFSPDLLRQRGGNGRERDSNITNDRNSFAGNAKAHDRRIEPQQRIAVQTNNPKIAGSMAYKRYEGYKRARTYGEFLKLGGTVGDYRNDEQKGFIREL